MARENNTMVTWEDLHFMVNNEGFEAGPMQPSNKNLATRAEIELAINPDVSLFSSYASNQAVPYGKLKNILRTSPGSISFGSGASNLNVQLYMPGNNSWVLSESLSWISTSLSSGNGNALINVAAVLNSGAQRSGVITITDQNTTNFVQITVSQAGNSTEQLDLFFSNSQATICDSVNNGTYYIEAGFGWFDTTKLFTNAAGTINAPAGYFRPGIGDWRFWNGTSFTGQGVCEGGF